MTAPSSRPDTPAQQHADTVRKMLILPSASEHAANAHAALDALLAEVERLTAERDEMKRHHLAELDEREVAWISTNHRAEAAEREREWLREQLDRQTENAAVFLRERNEAHAKIDRLISRGIEDLQFDLRVAEALAERHEAERDDLVHAFQEICDDWCSGHMGDCNCIVCSLVSDALNIRRDGQGAL